VLAPRDQIEVGLAASADVTPNLSLFVTATGDAGERRYRALRGAARLRLTF
jgi:outer membrane autotransporter protein